MKKVFAILLAFSMLLVPVLSPAEGAEAAPKYGFTGEWYGELQGLVLKLTLNEDGTYFAEVVPQPDQSAEGTWIFTDGFLYLDGSETPTINVLGNDVIKWISFDIFLRREAPETYTPAEIMADAQAEWMAGCWKAQYTEANGAMLLSEAAGDNTVIYIEGNHVVTTGKFFGDGVLEMTWADGALSCAAEGGSLTLQLQQDGFLRFTCAADQTVTLYLLPTYVEGLSPEPEVTPEP